MMRAAAARTATPVQWSLRQAQPVCRSISETASATSASTDAVDSPPRSS
jgi:hypothetical protein